MCHAHVRILPDCWRDSVWFLRNHSRSSQGAEHQKAATHTSVGEWHTSQHMASCFSLANFGKQISLIVFLTQTFVWSIPWPGHFFPLPQINFHLHVAFGRSLSTNKSHFPFFSVFYFSRDTGGGGDYPESEELISRPPRWGEEAGDSSAGSWLGKGKGLHFMQQWQLQMWE